MNNMSRMSFSEIRNKKIGLENSMDRLAGELHEVNKELTKRFGTFETLCVAPATTVTARMTGNRGTQDRESHSRHDLMASHGRACRSPVEGHGIDVGLRCGRETADASDVAR